MILTYQYRIKDSGIKKNLIVMSSQVNFIWNSCNEVVRKRWKESRFYTDESILRSLTKGSSKELDINAQTIQAISEELLKNTKQFKKSLRFRSRKKKLGWIPFNGQTFKFYGNYSTYNKCKIRYWYHRELPKDAVIKCGSINEDSQGKWYLNLVVSFPEYLEQSEEKEVGIDLNIQNILATSDEEIIKRDNFSKKSEEKLAKAQRHNKKRQVKKIHAKIKNKRKDWNHKRTFELAEKYRNIFVGDTSTTEILTDFNKINRAIYDASWFELKTLLSYKVIRRQGVYLEVSEKENASTETCSSCLARAGPSGQESLRIREWTCSNCRTKHNRDINAACNHLRLGRETLRASKIA
jgi:putative transposase